MREIKFRAYHQMLKQFYYGSDIFLLKDLFGRVSADPDAYELSQYTGLKDKNGVEIYEGDLLKVKYCGWDFIGEVIYRHEIAGFEVFRHQKGNNKLFQICPGMEVIGNIYENKDLLEVKDESISRR